MYQIYQLEETEITSVRILNQSQTKTLDIYHRTGPNMYRQYMRIPPKTAHSHVFMQKMPTNLYGSHEQLVVCKLTSRQTYSTN